MIRKLTLAAAMLATAATLAGCVVAPAPGYGHPGCRWVPPHYGAYGVFHPGHCA